ncbi:MAG: hypothetical protein GMKNLPBB_00061 [Myxococcota bacterium]|nr:hypothetical protein [Myxococcota bacterium]
MRKPWLTIPVTFWMWPASFAWMLIASACVLFTMPFLPYRKLNPIAAKLMSWCVYLGFNRVEIVRAPGFDPTRPSLYCQNHVSVLDGHIACVAIPTPFCGMMNAWHFRIPGYGWVMKHTGGIPVFPRTTGRTHETISIARSRAAEGLSILAFPEAHRTLDGKVREFRTGVFHIARDAGLPVVPMAIAGIHDINHKGSNWFTPGTIRVLLGAQIETEGCSSEDIPDLAKQTRQVIAGWVENGVAPERPSA